MQYFKTFTLMFVCIFLISACGKQSDEKTYTSYNQCMKDEIRKNDSKQNKFINEYCRGEFPKKIVRHVLDSTEVSLSQYDGKFYIHNHSDYNVTTLKVHIWEQKLGDDICRKSIDWNNKINLLPGNMVLKPGREVYAGKNPCFAFCNPCVDYRAESLYYVDE